MPEHQDLTLLHPDHKLGRDIASEATWADRYRDSDRDASGERYGQGAVVDAGAAAGQGTALLMRAIGLITYRLLIRRARRSETTSVAVRSLCRKKGYRRGRRRTRRPDGRLRLAVLECSQEPGARGLGPRRRARRSCYLKIQRRLWHWLKCHPPPLSPDRARPRPIGQARHAPCRSPQRYPFGRRKCRRLRRGPQGPSGS